MTREKHGTKRRNSADRSDRGIPSSNKHDSGTTANTPRSWWMWLLCPFIAIFSFFILDSILPDDNFTTRLRKVAVGVLALGSSGYFTTIIDVINDPSGPRGNATWFVLILDGLPMIITPWVTFVYCRVTKRIPDVLFSVLGLICVFSRVIASVTVHNADLEPMCFAYMMATLLTNLPKPVQVVSIALTSVALIINTLVLPDMGVDKYLYFPGADPNTAVSFMTLATYRIAFVLKTAGILMVISQFNFLVAKAEGAVNVCKLLAEKLQRYDTKAARELLRTLQSGNGDCPMDPELLLVFEGIVNNLEEYRPHLPNYMLSRDVEPDSESEADLVRMESTRQPSERRYPTDSSSFHAPSEGQTSRRASVSARSEASVDMSSSMLVMKANVSACLLSVDWTVDFSVSLCNAFIAIINEVAQSTQASLHSFVGDQVVATWNATRKVAKHESRACVFPLRVRAAAASHASLRTAVALSSMTATNAAESCFAGDSHLRLFACSAPGLWHMAASGLHKIKHHHISVADHDTRYHAKFDLDFQGIAVLPPSDVKSVKTKNQGPHQRCLYELLTEHPSGDDGDQEWMYAIEGYRGGEKKLTKAVETFAAGDAAGALVVMKELQGEPCGSEPAVQELMREMEASTYARASTAVPP